MEREMIIRIAFFLPALRPCCFFSSPRRRLQTRGHVPRALRAAFFFFSPTTERRRRLRPHYPSPFVLVVGYLLPASLFFLSLSLFLLPCCVDPSLFFL